MARIICQRCGYPQAVCLCEHVRPLQSRHRLVILQHPSEAEHAKNSARLLPLCLPQTQIWQGETPEDFASLRQRLEGDPNPSYLLYPSQQSLPVEKLNGGNMPEAATLLLLDGTWRKAYRIYQLNPWLQRLPALTFANPPASRYRIRKASQDNSLSTLEAAAYCLQQLEGCDVSPLLELFEARVQRQLGKMPDSVKSRY